MRVRSFLLALALALAALLIALAAALVGVLLLLARLGLTGGRVDQGGQSARTAGPAPERCLRATRCRDRNLCEGMMLTLELADTAGLRWAQNTVTQHHYLRRPVDTRCSVLAYLVMRDRERVAIAGHSLKTITDYYGPPDVETLRPWVERVYDLLAREMGQAQVRKQA